MFYHMLLMVKLVKRGVMAHESDRCRKPYQHHHLNIASYRDLLSDGCDNTLVLLAHLRYSCS